MTSVQCPLVGDPLYGKRKNPFGFKGQCLHCYQLGLLHPIGGHELLFQAEYPDDMDSLLHKLEQQYPTII